jgi:hypothetical protein
MDDYVFFSFNDGVPLPPESNTHKDYQKYLNTEDELEDMIIDGVLDIYVDSDGSFHYHASEATRAALPPDVKCKFTTFANMLHKRGLNINRYNRYKYMLRRMNP